MNSAYIIATIAGAIAATLAADLVIAAPALPRESCATDPRGDWTEPERWAWTEICEGRRADFNQRVGLPNRLSQSFLETILLHEPYRAAIPRQGVRINGAWFPEHINLANARIGQVLWLNNSRFDQGVNLSEANFQSHLTFNGSIFADDLNLFGLEVDGGLGMFGATVAGVLAMDFLKVDQLSMDSGAFAEVNLNGAKVEGQLGIIGATVSGALSMGNLEAGQLFMNRGGFTGANLNSAKVEGQLDMIGATVSEWLFMGNLEAGDLRMDGGEFAEVNLNRAKVEGQLGMIGASVSGALDMDSLEIEQFSMNGGAFAEVNLNGAKVGGQLDMTGATVSGALVIESVAVGDTLFMRGAEVGDRVSMSFGSIGNLDLSGARLGTLDLTGSKIGVLRLGSAMHESAQWREDALLVLWNTEVDALQDRSERDQWPRLILDGFTYQRLGGFAGATADADMLSRRVSWFTEWLAKDEEYSPQPYRQLAGFFRTAGDNRKADAILYSGRERERDESVGLAWWGLTLLKYTIGYGLGYRQFWSLYWVAGFVLTGVIVLWRSDAIRTNGLPWTVACSFDLLLPVVRLNDRHRDYVQEMAGLGIYYFYVHQIAGWVLASFLIAGLSGLPQL